MAIGDIVIQHRKSREEHGHLLTSLNVWYEHAIVVSDDPFILVSHDGNMLWQSQSPRDFVFLSPAHPDNTKLALARLKRDRAHGLLKPIAQRKARGKARSGQEPKRGLKRGHTNSPFAR